MSSNSSFQLIFEVINHTDAACHAIAGNITSIDNKVSVFADTQKEATVNAKDLAVGLSGLATAGFSLYMSFDRIEKSQVALDRANLMVKRSTEGVDQATKTYNETVAKYGSASAEAADAADKLKIAQEALTVSQERADLAQNNVNNAMLTFGLSIIPTSITAIASLTKIMEALNIASAAELAARLAEIPAYIAATAASAAHAIAEGIETAATWLLVTATATQIGLLTLGIGLVVAATAVALFLATTMSTTATKTGEFNTSLDGVNSNLKNTEALLNTTADTLGNFASALSTGNAQLERNNQRIYGLNHDLADAEEAWGKLRRQVMQYQLEGKDVPATLQAQTDAARDNYESILDQISGLEDVNGKLKEHISQLEADAAAEKARAETITKMTDKLTNDFELMSAAADSNLGAIKKAFDAAFNAGDIGKATRIVRTFADEYKISMDDALGVIKDFKDAQAEIPKSIEEQLIGKAQKDLQTFKDCATGKFAGISTIGKESMDTLVTDVNDLLSRGLVGEAQDLIKAFQDCSTDKMADTAASIQASMDEMVKNGINSAAEYAKYATLSEWLEAIKRQMAQAVVIVSSGVNNIGEYLAPINAGYGGMGGPSNRIIPLQEGGIVTRPTLALIGEHGPEAVTPLNEKVGEGNVVINVNIDGSADMRTVAEIERRLQNVVIENSTSNAATTHKRIRFGGRVT